MMRTLLTSCVAVLLLVLPLAAQEGTSPATQSAFAESEQVSQEIARLEAELGKVRDTSPDGADLMVKLVELYHQHGRVFGLLRTGQRFIAIHPNRPEHRDMMLKVLDGLQAASRNKEIAATTRQFLSRYPEDPACPQVELQLARALEQLDDYPAAAQAHEAVWRRQPETPEGRLAGVRALNLYQTFNSLDSFKRGATFAEEMLGKTPDSDAGFATQIGLRALYSWERAGDWARFNLAAHKLLQRKLPKDRLALRELHRRVAENYTRLGQYTNAAESLKAARAIEDRQDLHRAHIQQLHNAQAKGAELEAVVNEYFQKYPQAADRFSMRSYVALAWMREANKPKALQLLAELLPYEAVSNASYFVSQNGNEPEKVAESERVLREAIAKNPAHAYYLRFVLAFEVYRDRMKDEAKTRQTLRELVSESPSNDGHTSQAIYWLLYNAPSDAEFQADLNRVLKARRQWAHWTGHRNYLHNWIQEARRNKDHRERADIARKALDAQNEDPWIRAWIASEDNNRGDAQAARAKLCEPPLLNELSDEQIRLALGNLAYYHRHYGNQQQRKDAATLYGKLAARFPKDWEIATNYLQTAVDYGPPEVAKEAALHLLKLEPERIDADGWYRLLRAADANQDAALARQAFAWIQKAQEKLGPEPQYSYVIGDILAKYGMQDEAKAYWERTVKLNTNESETRECARRLQALLVDAEKMPDIPAQLAFLHERIAAAGDYHGAYSMLAADLYLRTGDLDNFEKVLTESRAHYLKNPFRIWGFEDHPPRNWLDQYRITKDLPDEARRRVFRTVRDLQIGRPSAIAALALLELPPAEEQPPMERLLSYQAPTGWVDNNSYDWDSLVPFAQATLTRKDYLAASTLLSGMLANIPNLDPSRKKAGQEMVGQSYARMGGTGLAIDENSPIAPLMQAALYLRLGDERLAFDAYTANRALFDQHRNEVPVDLILFVCDSHIAAGGDENFDRAEDILRNWLVKNSEVAEIEDSTKARVQLLLAKNYFKAQRYDVARSEYTTVINRYPKTAEAVEAEFGIGETFMSQKVYDQAEAVFEKLAGSRERDVVIRAEFLRGVLANRRGDRDEARAIFRAVLDRVPSIELANQALYNLAEVYGAEQRYMDQLELLRTVGRLGRSSKRTHLPGMPLSIVVQDSDLGTSQGRTKIPVRVITEPGGDEEIVELLSGTSKGLFRGELETRLGQATKGDRVLQLTGNDTIRCDYPDEFKAQFRSAPISDAEMRVAADAKFEISSSKIIDRDKITFSERLEREAREQEDADRRVSQDRPTNQIKPGNLVYLQTQDADRDLTDQADEIPVILRATSGDQVKVLLKETGPHTGIFEGTAATGELPAGALASDTAIEHSPLMAIDQSPETCWLSEPDGATPKWLSVDMKDLRVISRVTISTPDPTQQAPIRGELQGSDDGRFWFRLASNPPPAEMESVQGEFGRMTARVYAGNYNNYSNWQQVVNLSKNGTPILEEPVDRLDWSLPAEHEDAKKSYGVIWQGKLVQPRSGAARIHVRGSLSAVMVDGLVELPVGPGNRSVDVWLERGTHDLTIFASTGDGSQGVAATWARADHNAQQVVLVPFRKSDFDLEDPAARPALPREPAQVNVADNVWNFRIDPLELRHVRLVVHEYLGEAIAINNIEIAGEDDGELHIPTQADILSLAANDTLEIAGGDVVTATYTDEFTQNTSGRSQLLTGTLTATYFNAQISPISYDFERQPNGNVATIRKQLVRIDPGERFIVEIVDYDLDQTNTPDKLRFKVAVNDGEPIELVAQETEEYSGIFTKEVDTSAKVEEGKLTVKPGDRIYCTYIDEQNTFPGHAVPREMVVYVNQPSEGQVRILETRVIQPPPDSAAPPRILYLTPPDPSATSTVAFEAPLTIEVLDRDAAKDSKSRVTVQLTTTDGAKIDVECVISDMFADYYRPGYQLNRLALEEGRFIGQVILQLGSSTSPDLVPLGAGMPRNLVGGSRVSEDGSRSIGETLVTRVLNLTGKDIISATYQDALRPGGKPMNRVATGRLIANGVLACTDRDYDRPVTQLHVGEKLFLKVEDADLDVSDERDFAKVEITTERGEKETLELEETAAHSGVFTGSIVLKPSEQPTPGNLQPGDLFIETYFGDTLNLKYLDRAASTESGELELTIEVPVVIGTDGLVQAFSKTFNDETLAVETKFHIAESYFELFKSHKNLGRAEEQRQDLEAGRRVLREVMEDYPNPKYVPRIAYLLGQFAQELQQWNEAIDSYVMIVRQYPESTLAPDAQYKLAQCYEEAERFDDALEAYVTLAATYPKSPLIANVMIRISDHFYKNESFEIAAQVGEKFLERFENHQWASRMAFRVGQCYYKGKEYRKAGDAFDRFSKIFPEDALTADSLFWAGESYRMANDTSQAFRRYNRCRWDFPASDAAKYARGRLALPEMLAQFEREANSVEDDN